MAGALLFWTPKVHNVKTCCRYPSKDLVWVALLIFIIRFGRCPSSSSFTFIFPFGNEFRLNQIEIWICSVDVWCYFSLNTLRPRQDGCHFGRRYFQMHFLEWKYAFLEWKYASEFWLKFKWNLFLRVQLTIFQHSLMRVSLLIYASLGLSELISDIWFIFFSKSYVLCWHLIAPLSKITNIIFKKFSSFIVCHVEEKNIYLVFDTYNLYYFLSLEDVLGLTNCISIIPSLWNLACGSGTVLQSNVKAVGKFKHQSLLPWAVLYTTQKRPQMISR